VGIPRFALALAVVAVAAGCATQYPAGVEEYYGGNCQAARSIYEQGAEGDKQSRALYLVRLGTLELESGNIEAAREDFVGATEIMGALKAEGEFNAIVGSESTKEYKGDPYERMMACWYLGLADYMSGDYNKAFPSFRSAAIADGGTSEERYQADAASVFIMMGKTREAFGDRRKAEEDYREAAGVYTFRDTVDAVGQALDKGYKEAALGVESEAAFNVAWDLINEGVSVGATQEQGPSKALWAAREYALQTLEKESQSKKGRSRLEGQDPNLIAGGVKAITAAAEKYIGAGASGASPLEPAVKSITAPGNNFLVVVGLGKGPFKYRTGEYGELAKIGQSSYPERSAEVYVDGKPIGRPATVEDTHYQASTRGGRAMDGVLAGKAVFKTATKYGAIAALVVAADASDKGRRRDALIVAGTLAALSAVTRPEADIRSWETLPDRIQMLGAKVSPGKHDVEVRFEGGTKRTFEDVEFREADETVLYVMSNGGGAWSCPKRTAL
jgi:tetratricopeptide (TPR) repeat protein